MNGAAAVPVVPAGATSYSYTFATGSITLDQTIAASFVRNPHALDLSVVGGGSAEAGVGSISGNLGGSAPGSFTYPFGDVVSLTATARLGGHLTAGAAAERHMWRRVDRRAPL